VQYLALGFQPNEMFKRIPSHCRIGGRSAIMPIGMSHELIKLSGRELGNFLGIVGAA
jgi:hypothetical protein